VKKRANTVFAVDPKAPVPPDIFARPPAGAPGLCALLAEEGSRRQGWSARFSVELAKRWSAPDRPVLLVDGDLSGASLHAMIGASNDEGLSDLIVFGASIDRVSSDVADGAHRFIPAGTVVADPEQVYGDARWATFLAEIRSRGELLLLYLPAESAGAEDLAARVDHVMRLAGGSSDNSPGGSATVIHVAPRDASGSDSSPADSPPVGQPAVEGTAEEVPRPTSGPEARSARTATLPKKSKSGMPASLPFLGGLLIVLLVAILLAAWFGLLEIPGITPAASVSLAALMPAIRGAGPNPS
jgi:hypothetical protein